ncbi:hypothetical protein FUAX_27630 [Fulvitalea axinellae]|uniref:Cytochrome c domain-containing protein n=1 Tax=Fulvitalea axinellae TaxID=1182444 RepID=A0AAU9DB74_9BACT|nr:hypothetical protein FUAX_27630 [Fulvitalea axinellae]
MKKRFGVGLFFVCLLLVTVTSCDKSVVRSSDSGWIGAILEQGKQQAKGDGFSPYSTKILSKGERLDIEVGIEGVDTLWLMALDGGNGSGWDHAVWGEPVLVDKAGKETSLTDLKIESEVTGWGKVLRNVNFEGKPLSLAGERLKNGLLAHAHSEVAFATGGKYVKLKAVVGVDDGSKPNTKVSFLVGERGLKTNWNAMAKRYPEGMGALSMALGSGNAMMWLADPDAKTLKAALAKSLANSGTAGAWYRERCAELADDKLKPALEFLGTVDGFKKALAILDNNDFGALERSVTNLKSAYGERYAGSEDFLRRIQASKNTFSSLKNELAKGDPGVLEKALKAKAEFASLAKEAMVAHPVLAENALMFVTRMQYLRDHHNSETLFQTDEINTEKFRGGSAIKSIRFGEGGNVKTLIASETGVVRDPDIHYDGQKFLFSMRRDIKDDYHVYEMNVDGTGMKQLTKSPGVSDIDPCYLPNDKIVFSSTREPKYCMCNVHIMANLHRMEADGANITQLGKSTLFEGHSTVLPDGRILYDRWEYVDRNFGDAQGLWTVNPDGTNHKLYWGNNTSSPGGVIDAKPIPNSSLMMAILGSCHDRPWGALALIDRSKGLEGKEPVVRTWPAYARDLISTEGYGKWDVFMQVRPRYEDPYPLDDKYFLCTRTVTKNTERTGLFLIDIYGNETLLYEEEGLGCFDPTVVMERKRERVIPENRKYDKTPGKFYVQNVYEGTHMDDVKPGEIKYLRVVESVEKKAWTGPAWNGQGVHRPAMNWHNFENKRVLGIVDVEEDGSAYFEVPADRFVYFQLLDKDKRMVQTMRSGTSLQPGETQGCVGCHENRLQAPLPIGSAKPMAMRKPANQLKPTWDREKPESMHFLRDIQPIFTANCVSCHDFGKDAGKVLNLAADKNMFFNASYIELRMKNYVKVIGAGPAALQGSYAWGANKSPLVKTIEGDHYGVKLTKEEKERIYEWLDVNAPYYPRFESAYPDNPVGRSPLTHAQVKRLSKLTGVNLMSLGTFRRKTGPQISFERPEVSPCLDGIRDNKAKYAEAVAIIKAGYEQLQRVPRADMKGFQPSEAHMKRLVKYMKFREAEEKSREAIRSGQKVFDGDGAK